jgi:hypothetical protein
MLIAKWRLPGKNLRKRQNKTEKTTNPDSESNRPARTAQRSRIDCATGLALALMLALPITGNSNLVVLVEASTNLANDYQ